MLGDATPTQLLNAVFYYNGKTYVYVVRTTASQHRSVAKVLSAPSDVKFSSTENAKDWWQCKSCHCNWKCITL